MLSDDVLDKVVERLANRIEQGNQYVLEQIAKKIKKIGKLSPTQAQQLVQVLKYGGDYEKIVKKLAKITKLNIRDIHKIFKEYAKSDYDFAKQFYDYRGIKYIPFDENMVLQEQIQAISQLTSQQYAEFARSKALGFSVKDAKGNVIYKGLKQTYDDAIDKAVLSISQGKTTFEDEMYRMLKELGTSGLKTLDFAGRAIRLDSAIRMHLNDALNQLHNNIVMDMAKDYNADGVEISVLSNPAPDHQYVQGRQFSKAEFEKFQNDMDAVSYDGKRFPATSEETGYDRRSIAQYNCRHKIFPIILGVSKPKFNDKQLQEIIDANNKGFEFEGKHYSMYEGAQLQRKLETKIRRNKDLQIEGRASGNKKLANESQIKINQYTREYKKLCKASGLPTYNERMKVKDYHKIRTTEDVINKWNEHFGKKYGSYDIFYGSVPYDEKLENWVSVDKALKDIDIDVLDQSLAQIEKIYDKYDLKDRGLTILRGNHGKAIAFTQGGNRVFLTSKMKDADALKAKIIEGVNTNNYTMKIRKDTELIYPITHEMGHIIENRYLMETNNRLLGVMNDQDKILDSEIKNKIINNVSARNGMSKDEIIKQFFSGYAKSKSNYEWFAESFAQLELGYKNIWIEEFEKWLKNS